MKRSASYTSAVLGSLFAFGLGDSALAACYTDGTCTNNGTITGTSSGHAIETTGSLDLTNNGSIIGAAGWSAIASGYGLALTNYGTLSGGNSGIFITGGSASITNKSGGVIEGSAYWGIHITNTATSADIVNDANATISGKTGILVQISGATITNRGTISSTAAWSSGLTDAGYGIKFSSGGATLTNYGTISGVTSAVYLGAGSNTINIYDGAVFTNGIDYNNTTGNTTNFYTGSYTLGVKNYSLSGNTINLRGTGTTLITTGVVSGTGNIVIVDNSVNSSVNSSASTVSNYASSVVNDLLSSPGVNDIIVQDIGIGDVFPHDAANDAPQGSASSAFFTDRQSEKTRKARLAFANVMTSSAAAQATGALINGSGQAADQYGNLVWSRSFGGAYFQDPFGSASGQRTYSGGTMLGYDFTNGAWRLGGFFGVGRMRTNRSLSLDHVTTDTVFGGAYGRYTFDNFNLDATMSGGSLNATTKRYINNGAEVATGNVKGYFISPEVALGYNMKLNDDWTFTPTGRLRYVGAFSDPYTETGSTQNVSYGKNVSQTLEERLELRLTRNVKDDRGLVSNYYLQAAAIAAQRIGPAGFSANLAGTAFTVGNGYARAKAGGSLGLGFNYKATRQVDVFGSFDATAYTDKSYSLAARGGLKFSF